MIGLQNLTSVQKFVCNDETEKNWFLCQFFCYKSLTENGKVVTSSRAVDTFKGKVSRLLLLLYNKRELKQMFQFLILDLFVWILLDAYVKALFWSSYFDKRIKYILEMSVVWKFTSTLSNQSILRDVCTSKY